MKILITGGTGFIGNAIANKLCDDGHQLVLLLKNKDSLKKIRCLNFKNQIIYSDSDISRLDHELKKVSGVDAVIHAATNYGREENDLISPLYTNLVLPIKLLQFCNNNSVNRFINLDTFFNQTSKKYDYLKLYTLTKKQLLEWGSLSSNVVNFINLKLFHVYGPNDKKDKFVPTLIKKLKLNETVDLTSGSQKRDFIYLDDVINAVCRSLSMPLVSCYQSFDIGTGKLTSVKEFVTLLHEICGSRSTLNFGVLQERAGELKNPYANLRSNDSLGWKYQVDIREGLHKMILGHKN